MSQNGVITLIIAISVIVIILAVYIFLEVFVFSKMRIKKRLKGIKENFNYLSSLLESQDNQYLNRLDGIQRTNLLYADAYQQCLERYTILKDGLNSEVQAILTDLDVAVEDKDVKEFKKILKENNNTLLQYEMDIKKLHSDLEELIRPEEDCRKDSLMLKDKYREVKALYEENKDSLESVKDRFEIFFNNVDKRFAKFEDLVDHAEYDEARQNLPALSKALTQIKSILSVLPHYLNEVDDIIPKQMGALLDKYHKYIDEKLPLSHLGLEEKLEDIKLNLIQLRDQFKELKVESAPERIEKAHLVLNDLNAAIDKEEEARIICSDLSNEVVAAYTNLSTGMTKLNNSIATYSKHYVIDSERQRILASLNADVNTLSGFKRRVDFHIYGINKTFYTNLLTMLNDLKDQIEKAQKTYDEFNIYLNSLYEDVSKAGTLLKQRYLRLKKSEATLRDFNNEVISNEFNERFDKSYLLLDEIYHILKVQPIDVLALNEKVSEADSYTNQLINEIADLGSYKILATDNIVLINRDRIKFNEVNDLVNQAEALYFEGKYASCYSMTETIIEKLKNKNN